MTFTQSAEKYYEEINLFGNIVRFFFIPDINPCLR